MITTLVVIGHILLINLSWNGLWQCCCWMYWRHWWSSTTATSMWNKMTNSFHAFRLFFVPLHNYSDTICMNSTQLTSLMPCKAASYFCWCFCSSTSKHSKSYLSGTNWLLVQIHICTHLINDGQWLTIANAVASHTLPLFLQSILLFYN